MRFLTTGTQTEPIGRTGILVVALLFSLAVSLLAGAAPAKSRLERFNLAQKDFERAGRQRADLEGTPPEQRKEKDYLGVVFLYRRAYDRAPFSSLGADALAAVAETYHEMGKQFDPKYWRGAIATYQLLRKEYPSTRYGDDALFNIAQIHHVHLKNLDAGLDAYQQLLKAYPRSRFAATARDRIKSIQTEQAEAKAAAEKAKAESAPLAPAPSPRAAASTDSRVEVRNIRYWNAKNYTRVVVDLEKEVSYMAGRIVNPDRIFFDLHNTRPSTVLMGKTFEVNEGLLDRIRVAENRDGITRVVLEVKSGEDYSVFSLPNPFRLVVDIRDQKALQQEVASGSPGAATRGEPAAGGSSKPGPSDPVPVGTTPAKAEPASASLPRTPGAPKPTQDGNHTLSRALGLKVGRIVLDPGHGGHDTGTVGPTGLMEKDLVLDVSWRLGRLLQEQRGAEVVFTREDDTFVPLENRIALANEKQADLFLSIHANSSRTAGVRGVETFYLNFTSDPEALELAARENALSQKSVHELQDLVRTISRNEKINESREMARVVQEHLHSGLRKTSRQIHDRGVKQAPFVVLIGGSMPSVLTEVGFLSNPDDEQLMKSPQGRQKVAEALFAGMSKYLEDLNSVAFTAQKPASSPQE